MSVETPKLYAERDSVTAEQALDWRAMAQRLANANMAWQRVEHHRSGTWRIRAAIERSNAEQAILNALAKEASSGAAPQPSVSAAEGGGPEPVQVQCTKCDGDGRVPSKEICARCGYTGCYTEDCDECNGTGHLAAQQEPKP